MPSTTAPAPKIVVQAMTKAYGNVVALNDVNFDVKNSEIVCILGPSGCGKTTLLNVVAGFESATTGMVQVDGRATDRPGPDRAVVFQTDALFPWLTSLGNVVFGVKTKSRSRLRETAVELLTALRLREFQDHYPYQLSGGMKQRVSIGRALIRDPGVLLMDEPFGALDALTRREMQQMMQDIWLRYKPTVIFITHDIDEAFFLGDRVFVMSGGPGKIRDIIEIPFERPRPYDLITHPSFNELKRRALISLDLTHVPS
jgi:NitT/TauT family transport system ATP-binding protein